MQYIDESEAFKRVTCTIRLGRQPVSKSQPQTTPEQTIPFLRKSLLGKNWSAENNKLPEAGEPQGLPTDEFERLFQQYKRAGHEYYQRLSQQTDKTAPR
ncbi:hypothetical protein GGR92_002176 [Spirosoma lacussanchae]|uniref:hypothetical protein n=1 Tax=Spirosoma lacussanchae TaxID=1884249 RepID=UPI00110958F0|nr:hypothetical protein [Spirosoma lacussanchae]